MAEDPRPPDGPVEHRSVRYERTDASLKAVLTIIGCAIVLAVLVHVLVWQFMVGYERQLAERRRSSFPLAPSPSTARPPEPRLEQIDRMDGSDAANVFARQKAKEDELRRYGPGDEAGFVQVPIEQAMHYLAGRLPARPEAPPAGPRHDLGLLDSGEPNSGRLFRKEPR